MPRNAGVYGSRQNQHFKVGWLGRETKKSVYYDTIIREKEQDRKYGNAFESERQRSWAKLKDQDDSPNTEPYHLAHHTKTPYFGKKRTDIHIKEDEYKGLRLPYDGTRSIYNLPEAGRVEQRESQLPKQGTQSKRAVYVPSFPLNKQGHELDEHPPENDDREYNHIPTTEYLYNHGGKITYRGSSFRSYDLHSMTNASPTGTRNTTPVVSGRTDCTSTKSSQGSERGLAKSLGSGHAEEKGEDRERRATQNSALSSVPPIDMDRVPRITYSDPPSAQALDPGPQTNHTNKSVNFQLTRSQGGGSHASSSSHHSLPPILQKIDTDGRVSRAKSELDLYREGLNTGYSIHSGSTSDPIVEKIRQWEEQRSRSQMSYY